MPAKNRGNWFLVIHLANIAKIHSPKKEHAHKKRTKIVRLWIGVVASIFAL